MAELTDDHLPPVAPAGAAKQRRGADTAGEPTEPRRAFLWGDRILFAAGGLLIGFMAAYLYLEKAAPQRPSLTDPHAGVPGVGPGAIRDLPDGAGSAAAPAAGVPGVSADPAVRQKLRELEEAVARDPKSYDLLVQLGNASYDAEDWRQAVDAYTRALKIKGTDPNVVTDLGVAYRNLGDIDKALQLFQQARTIDPGHAQSLFNMAVVYGVDRNDPAKAKELLLQLKKEHPELPGLSKLEDAMNSKG